MKRVVEEYSLTEKVKELVIAMTQNNAKVHINALASSSLSLLVAACKQKTKEFNHLVILPDREQAAYVANDLEELFEQTNLDYTQKSILFYPSTNKHPYSEDNTQNANIILRLETLNRLNNGEKLIVVTYPEAIAEKVAPKKQIASNSTKIAINDEISVDNLIDILDEYHFERVDFVTHSGEYAIRGGIIDIFSFSQQKPCRIELNGDAVESIRKFDVVSQMSIEKVNDFVIVPNLQSSEATNDSTPVSFFSYFGKDTIIWTRYLAITLEKIDKLLNAANEAYVKTQSLIKPLSPDKIYSTKESIQKAIESYNLIEDGMTYFKTTYQNINYSTTTQPTFNKSFDLFADNLEQLTLDGYKNHFLVKDIKQQHRIENIIQEYSSKGKNIIVDYLPFSLSAGFVDNETKSSFFTDHQLFNRYHKYIIDDSSADNEKLTLENLVTLKPGDYVTHIDYGVGKFAGLEKINNNGREQEAIRLIYKDGDMLYISIHSLHKISRYSGAEGVEPKLNRLGSGAWQALKQKTKKKVKDIAKDLIALYAKRKASQGYAFSADSYLQNELEASFMYEDTVDQYKATKAVKQDMEKSYPMDRLVCGDVGFGKTEVAIRAAFKAVCDSKQVAVLVPTTILAFQHYKTFSERLHNMPCRVDYLNRFRSAKEKTQILKDLKEGKIDILIGTHRIVGKDVHFKDLGLLIIDEEQKFGVSMKEKIRQMKVNIDTLTLTATPIPRTLQFSLMGARDLSIISTPPPNRQPINTQVCSFDENVIRDAVLYELSRGGQVFFVNNRVQNIQEIAALVRRLVPNAKIGVGHGQMEGAALENVMMDFINEEYDVLVCTTIVENGLDIPNANTIIINDAQNYGLSDLHQLRGRVGRSNKKAFCYLLVPSKEILSEQASKRLQAIEEFSSIGSGFAIAMRDLDIRGAGNILGAEQSGFISEIGYDMYNKILSEAIQELKEDEFKDLYDKSYEQQTNPFVYQRECTIETDLEVLIPDYYITNITERLKIYKQLDSMTEEKELDDMAKELKDRFGKIPRQTLDLFDIVRLRKIASELGIEKVVLKRSKMTLNFINRGNRKIEDKVFQNVMLFVNQYAHRSQLKSENETLQLIVTGVQTVAEAKKILGRLSE